MGQHGHQITDTDRRRQATARIEVRDLIYLVYTGHAIDMRPTRAGMPILFNLSLYFSIHQERV